MQDRVGDLAGWEWRAVSPACSPSEPPDSGTNVVWIRRSFSPRALAVALVRFYGSKGRYFNTADERGREAFAQLCDVDDPAMSGYPIVDAIADALLGTTDPDPAAARLGDTVDDLSAKLHRLGYERLWAEAFKNVT